MHLRSLARRLAAALLLACPCMTAADEKPAVPPGKAELSRLAQRIETVLMDTELAFFYPGCVDVENGGFRHATAVEWNGFTTAQREKNLTFQARMVWTAAEVARLRPAQAERFLGYARHGFAFLRDRMWDAEQGGFYHMVGERGGLSTTVGTDKEAYSNAFAIYALANLARAGGDRDALDLALRGFRWLDAHGHDDTHLGYHEFLRRDGTPGIDPARAATPLNDFDTTGGPDTRKSSDAHIHLMEAFTTLYLASGDAAVRRRLEETFHLVRDVMTIPQPTCMATLYTRDWRPLPGRGSFGHDVETTFLLLDAAEALGLDGDDGTWRIAKGLTDHALAFAWDDQDGGIIERGDALGRAEPSRSKIWWAQAEGLNTLLLLYERTGDPRYWQRFAKMWTYIEGCGIDFQEGGWRFALDPVKPSTGWKIHPTKAAYHTGRAMLLVVDRLRRLAAR